jgi:hypothetical protein
MRWRLGHKYDRQGRELADRHYNRRKVGSPQFVPPGRAVVLVSVCGRAVWVTSWPYAEYVRHAWAGAWVNSLFRNEGAGLSSELILEAVAATRAVWPEPPPIGLITFVDARKVASRNPGYCYRRAGFERVGVTRKEKLLAFRLAPEAMPAAEVALGGPRD